MQVWMQKSLWIRGGVCCCVPGGVGAGEGGAGTPYAFQRLRLGGKALDGELARLVPRGGPNQRSDRRRPPAAGPRLPSRSAFAESQNSLPHHLPLRPSARSVSAGGRYCSQAAPETWSVSLEGRFCSPAPPDTRSVSAGGMSCSRAAPETWFVSAEGRFCSRAPPATQSISAEGRFCSPTPISAKLPHVVPCLISLKAMLRCGKGRLPGSPHRRPPLECVQWVLRCGSLAKTTLRWHNVPEPERCATKQTEAHQD